MACRKVHTSWPAFLLAALTATALARVASQQASGGADTVSFRLIVVESQDAAAQVLEAIAKGENLVALAARVSVDPSAANGGLIGPVQAADLRPELRRALEGMRVGEVSAVVRLPTGFGVLKRVPEVEAAAVIAPASGGPT